MCDRRTFNLSILSLGSSIALRSSSNAFSSSRFGLVDPFTVRDATQLDKFRPPVLMPLPSSPIPLVKDVKGVTYYEGDMNGRKDSDKFKSDMAAVAQLNRFVVEVELNCALIRFGTPHSEILTKRCFDMLNFWAENSALESAVGEQAKYHRCWLFTGLAIAYLSIKRQISRFDCSRIDIWFSRLGEICLNSLKGYSNNIFYWSGAAAICAGLASNNDKLFSDGLLVGRKGLSGVNLDGSLNSELARKSRSIGYHSFALTPLLLISLMASCKNFNLFDYNNSAIFRIADYVLNSWTDVDRLSIPSWPWLMSVVSPDKYGFLLRDAAYFDPYCGGRVDVLFGG